MSLVTNQTMIKDILIAWTDHWGWLWMTVGLLGNIVVVIIFKE